MLAQQPVEMRRSLLGRTVYRGEFGGNGVAHFAQSVAEVGGDEGFVFYDEDSHFRHMGSVGL